MKKILFVTMHNVPNYGSFLQTYATQEIIKKIGMEAEILDYVPYVRSERFFLFNHLGRKKSFLKECITTLFYFPTKVRLWRIFQKEQKKYYNMTRKYKSSEDLERHIPYADIYMTGSDQVWSSVTNLGYDGVYFLDFVGHDNKKIAFSASIGLEKLEKDYQKEIQTSIMQYDAVSVREDSAVELLENIGIKNVKHILDPTQILTVKEWDNYIQTSRINITEEPYVLIYLLGRDNCAINYAEKIAKTIGAKIYKISWDGIYNKKIDRYYKFVRPADMLKLIKNAQFVVTNSFHGTALSIEFGKQFYTVAKEINPRFDSILRLYGLEDRFINEKEDSLDYMDVKKIDYERVNKIIKHMRSKTYGFLLESVEK